MSDGDDLVAVLSRALRICIERHGARGTEQLLAHILATLERARRDLERESLH